MDLETRPRLDYIRFVEEIYCFCCPSRDVTCLRKSWSQRRKIQVEKKKKKKKKTLKVVAVTEPQPKNSWSWGEIHLLVNW